MRHYQAVLGAGLMGISGFIFLSILGYNPSDYTALLSDLPVRNVAGPVGAWTGHLFRSAFGAVSYIVALLLALPGFSLLARNRIKKIVEISILIFVLSIGLSALFATFNNEIVQISGGYVGAFVSFFFYTLIGRTSTYIILSSITLSCAVLIAVYSLPAKREKIVSYIPAEKIRNVFTRLFRRGKEDLPLLRIGAEGRYKSGSYPWVIKKKMVVYETEKLDVPFENFCLPQLPEESPGQKMGLLTGQCECNVTYQESTESYGIIKEEEAEVVLREGDYYVENGSEAIIGDKSHNSTDSDISEEYEDDMIPGNDVFLSDSEVPPLNQVASVDSFQDDEEKNRKDAGESSNVNIHERVFDEIPINEEYIIPTSFLSSSKPHDTESWKNEIRRNSELLKNTLADFGIDADVVNVNRGPVITLYEMQIAPGIKVNRVASLADDIAMALAAQRVRIVAPIPGKSAIGIEIPNRYREAVTLGDIVKSDEFQAFEGSLVVALGKDILGNPVMLDLKRQPHLLIAGATGAGKSVCVNSIITSLIYNYEPNYLRFILIDPKMVELQLYNGLPHLLTPVIVDPATAPMVLKWAMQEMQRRYCLLSDMNTRDIERYNEKIVHKKIGLEKMPYIVIIIDEMADLMMTSKEVEGYITRIAQKARAVGIHLVVATQRPSVDIITGIIKANFPARIAFQVAQKNDSRTIIDQNGAEKLLGRGDMLYQSPTGSYPVRVQGGYISEEEIEKIASHLRLLGRPSYIDIEESLREEESKEIEESTDELFIDAIKIVEETKKASACYLQRRLAIGY
ncbi:MAG: DNA translocase FtsK, partial [Chrysiogenales bacterium]